MFQRFAWQASGMTCRTESAASSFVAGIAGTSRLGATAIPAAIPARASFAQGPLSERPVVACRRVLPAEEGVRMQEGRGFSNVTCECHISSSPDTLRHSEAIRADGG